MKLCLTCSGPIPMPDPHDYQFCGGSITCVEIDRVHDVREAHGEALLEASLKHYATLFDWLSQIQVLCGVPGISGKTTVEIVRERLEAGYLLSTWAASINWKAGNTSFGGNTQEWLDGLRERIETVQAGVVLEPPTMEKL